MRPSIGFNLGLLGLLAQAGAVSPVAAQQYPEGEALYEANCVACHSVGTERVVGPGLQGVTERRDRRWLIEFIAAPDRLIARGDSLANALLAEYGMPMPNLGLDRSQAEKIVDFLATATPETPEFAPAPPEALPGGDPAVGHALFTGRQRFEKGGAACISCHGVAGLGAFGGGNLAKDLTGAAAAYGPGLTQVLQTMPFPVMKDVFAERPLTDSEIADLSAFLARADAARAPSESRVPFPAAGFGGMIVLAALAGILWRGRLQGVRKPLIGEKR